MSEAKHTLPVRLSMAQSSTVEALAKLLGKSRNALIVEALKRVALENKRLWPESLDGRRRAEPPPPRKPLPNVEGLSVVQQFTRWRAIVETMAQHPEQMNEDQWRLMLAHYRAINGSRRKPGPLRPGLTDTWHDLNKHRAMIAAGQTLPPDIPKSDGRLMVALWHYDRFRDQWAKRTPLNRAELTPQRLERVQASDRRRQANKRARDAATKERAFQQKVQEFCSEDELEKAAVG